MLVGCILITFDIHLSDTIFVSAKLRLNIITPVCIPKFAFINYILERLRFGQKLPFTFISIAHSRD